MTSNRTRTVLEKSNQNGEKGRTAANEKDDRNKFIPDFPFAKIIKE